MRISNHIKNNLISLLKVIYKILLYSGATAFWICIFIFIITVIKMESGRKIIQPLINGYTFVKKTDSNSAPYLINRESGIIIKNVKSFCMEGNYIHGKRSLDSRNGERFFIINSTVRDDIFLTEKWNPWNEDDKAEYLHYLKEYGLHECDSSNTVFPLNN